VKGGVKGGVNGGAAGGGAGHVHRPAAPLPIPRAPLTAAAAGGSTHCLLALLAAGAPADLPGEGGLTPLHAAATSGRISCIQALLEAGADPEIADGHGRSALRLAAISGYAEALPLLLPPSRSQLDRELDGALVAGELRAAALLAEASGTPSLLWRAIEQQGVDGALLRGLIRQIPRGGLRAQAVEAGGAKCVC
jgi:ankyrin repeat protein